MSKIDQKIGLIGVGNMGTAIVKGLLDKQMVSADNIFVYDKVKDKASNFASDHQVNKAARVDALIEQSDIILLAVKPQDLGAVGKEMAGKSAAKKYLISILAGTPIQKIKKATACVKIVRAMPNLGAGVGESMTAIASNYPDALMIAEKIFSGCGKVVKLEEKFFDLVTAVSGSGPAYFFHLMELLMKEGVMNGLKEKDARLLAVQTAVGAALLAAASEDTPAELREKVTSKGGTTEAALKVLAGGKFSSLFHKALQAALKRGKQISLKK